MSCGVMAKAPIKYECGAVIMKQAINEMDQMCPAVLPWINKVIAAQREGEKEKEWRGGGSEEAREREEGMDLDTHSAARLPKT